MRPIQVPSNQNPSQSDDKLFEFLSNEEYRKKYNQLLGQTRTFQNLCANNSFLSKCLEEKLVPKSFRISNQPHNKESLKF